MINILTHACQFFYTWWNKALGCRFRFLNLLYLLLRDTCAQSDTHHPAIQFPPLSFLVGFGFEFCHVSKLGILHEIHVLLFYLLKADRVQVPCVFNLSDVVELRELSNSESVSCEVSSRGLGIWSVSTEHDSVACEALVIIPHCCMPVVGFNHFSSQRISHIRHLNSKYYVNIKWRKFFVFRIGLCLTV